MKAKGGGLMRIHCTYTHMQVLYVIVVVHLGIDKKFYKLQDVGTWHQMCKCTIISLFFPNETEKDFKYRLVQFL